MLAAPKHVLTNPRVVRGLYAAALLPKPSGSGSPARS